MASLIFSAIDSMDEVVEVYIRTPLLFGKCCAFICRDLKLNLTPEKWRENSVRDHLKKNRNILQVLVMHIGLIK